MASALSGKSIAGHWPDYYDNLPGGSEHGRAVVAAKLLERPSWSTPLQVKRVQADHVAPMERGRP